MLHMETKTGKNVAWRMISQRALNEALDRLHWFAECLGFAGLVAILTLSLGHSSRVAAISAAISSTSVLLVILLRRPNLYKVDSEDRALIPADECLVEDAGILSNLEERDDDRILHITALQPLSSPTDHSHLSGADSGECQSGDELIAAVRFLESELRSSREHIVNLRSERDGLEARMKKLQETVIAQSDEMSVMQRLLRSKTLLLADVIRDLIASPCTESAPVWFAKLRHLFRSMGLSNERALLRARNELLRRQGMAQRHSATDLDVNDDAIAANVYADGVVINSDILRTTNDSHLEAITNKSVKNIE